MKEKAQSDKIFLGIIIALLIAGTAMFISASLGILAKNDTKFYNVLFTQLVLGIGVGGLFLYAASKIHFSFWRTYSLYIFIGSLILTALVFVPHLGFAHGGARRWIALGPISFQPAEFLKIGFVIYFAAWLSYAKEKSQTIKHGIVPFLCCIGAAAVVLLLQPDTKSLILMITAGIAMLFVSGFPWKYLVGFALLGILGIGVLAFFRPYVAARIKTFIHPSADQSGASYQLQQSLIALGSGGVLGRGFGQSVQKFSYLPEPQGDSIFAVVGEELGFVGGIALIGLFVAFALRGLRIAYRAPSAFSRLLVVGIVILILAQSFLNIASIIGVFPLTGVPLVFVSQGGTALAIALLAVGIVLNISKFQKKI